LAVEKGEALYKKSALGVWRPTMRGSRRRRVLHKGGEGGRGKEIKKEKVKSHNPIECRNKNPTRKRKSRES